MAVINKNFKGVVVMKRLLRVLSVTLALVMVVMAVPSFASAEGETEAKYKYLYEEYSQSWKTTDQGKTLFGIGGNGWQNGEYFKYDCQTEDNTKILKCDMSKRYNSNGEEVGIESWSISVQNWALNNSPIILNNIINNGALHFQLKIEGTGFVNANDFRVYILGQNWTGSKKAVLPGASSITPDGEYHDVYIPLSNFAAANSADSDAWMNVREIRFAKISLEGENFAYIKNIKFVAANAVSVKAARDGEGTKLTWAVANDTAVQNTIAGYKIYRDGAELADVDNTVTSYADTAVLGEGRYCYTVVPYSADGGTKTELTEYKSNMAFADVEKTDANKVWEPAAYSCDWKPEYFAAGYVKENATNSDKDFIPAGLSATGYSMGNNVTTNMPNYLEFTFADGSRDISAYVAHGYVNMFVYVDAPNATAAQYDKWFNVYLSSLTDWKASKYINNTLPLNKWTKISIPISEFTGDYDKTNMYAVRAQAGKSDIENCDIYIQGVSITVVDTVECGDTVIKYSDGDVITGNTVYTGVDYDVSITLYNDTSSAQTPVYMVAVYKNGALTSVYMPTVEATDAKSEKTYKQKINISDSDDEAEYTVKAFMFKSLDSMTPIDKR